MKELQLRNRQRDRKLRTKVLRQLAVHLLEEQLNLSSYEMAAHFVSANEMSRINQQFLQHEGSTDVITFNFLEGYDETPREEKVDLAGEIYISVADAVKQGAEFKTDWTEELARYLVHGVLHLRGYDDLKPAPRKLMKREENRLLKGLGRAFDLRNISA